MPSKTGIYHCLILGLGLYAMASGFPRTKPTDQRAHIAKACALLLPGYTRGRHLGRAVTVDHQTMAVLILR